MEKNSLLGDISSNLANVIPLFSAMARVTASKSSASCSQCSSPCLIRLSKTPSPNLPMEAWSVTRFHLHVLMEMQRCRQKQFRHWQKREESRDFARPNETVRGLLPVMPHGSGHHRHPESTTNYTGQNIKIRCVRCYYTSQRYKFISFDNFALSPLLYLRATSTVSRTYLKPLMYGVSKNMLISY